MRVVLQEAVERENLEALLDDLRRQLREHAPVPRGHDPGSCASPAAAAYTTSRQPSGAPCSRQESPGTSGAVGVECEQQQLTGKRGLESARMERRAESGERNQACEGRRSGGGGEDCCSGSGGDVLGVDMASALCDNGFG